MLFGCASTAHNLELDSKNYMGMNQPSPVGGKTCMVAPSATFFTQKTTTAIVLPVQGL